MFKTVFENSFDTIVEFLTAMRRARRPSRVRVLRLGHVANLDPLIDMGLLEEPHQIDCVIGVTGGFRPTPQNLAHMADQIPGGAEGPSNWA